VVKTHHGYMTVHEECVRTLVEHGLAEPIELGPDEPACPWDEDTQEIDDEDA